MSRQDPAALESPTTDVAAVAEPGRTSMLAAFRYRDFRLFWFGLLVSNIGTWMQQFAMGWLVVLLAIRDGTPHLAPLYLGLTGLARALPGLALGLVAGAVADRADRRRLLIVTQTTAGLLAALLATLTVSNAITIWAILLIGAANSTVFSFDAPTRQSMVPRLVPARDLMSAIGLNSAAFNGPQIIGPAIGGILIVPFGPGGLFFLNAVSYGAVVVALLLMEPIPPVSRAPGLDMLSRVRAGIGYIRNDPVLKWIVVLVATTALLSRPYVFLLPAVATNVFGVGATELSWLIAASGVGAFSGSLVVANLGAVRNRGRLFLVAAGASGLALTVFALQRTLAPALVATLVTSLFTMAFVGLANTILQTNSPDHMLGRVMSVYTMFFMGIMPLGQLMEGALGSVFGVDDVLFVAGICAASAAAYVFIRVRAVRNLTSDRRPHPHPHPRGMPRAETSPAE
ncbi:MAG TPA: MFS transporter [Candidatus Dormibacteraeota bacterium]|nr:MFS transporter [Candidatus Dormibacteraeota bacterium]